MASGSFAPARRVRCGVGRGGYSIDSRVRLLFSGCPVSVSVSVSSPDADPGPDANADPDPGPDANANADPNADPNAGPDPNADPGPDAAIFAADLGIWSRGLARVALPGVPVE